MARRRRGRRHGRGRGRVRRATTTERRAAGSSSGSSSSSSKQGGTLNGAGATFPQPVYTEWAARFKDETGTTVNYQAIGSGGGIAQFTAGTVDFGATDARDEARGGARRPKKKGEPVHIPTVLGAVTVSYNVAGLDKGLKLDGATVADIFLGKIKKWNDPAIAKLNSGRKLPDTDITVCHRSDESGTTRTSRSSSPTTPRVEERPRRRQDRQVADGHGRQGQRRRGRPASSRPTARSATSSRPTRCRTTSRPPTSRTRRASTSSPTLEATSAAGEGVTGPGRPAFQRDQRARRGRLPDRRGDVPARLPGHVQGGRSTRQKAKPSRAG